ncbi:MAG: hypothetical protein L3J10_05065 [Sulfurimonas sp.]|nr:hypothetical protein [Sulfurimonas sp.]
MNQYVNEWQELKILFSIKKEKRIDNGNSTDWGNLNQIILGTALVAGCKLLEQADLKYSDANSTLLFKMRNAFIHNDNDISLYNGVREANSGAEALVDNFIHQHGNKYFEKDSNKKIIFNEKIIHFITMTLIENYSEI